MPGLGRRIVFRLILVAVGLLASEAAARLFCRLGPAHLSRASLGAERWTLVHPAVQAGVPPGSTPLDREKQVPHPYVGSVFDPEHPRLLAPNSSRINDLGQFQIDDADPSRFTIGVFGGSVAAWMPVHSRATLRQLPAAVTGDRAVAIRDFAQFGHKQPQHLMSLNYALALGERFDVVVLVDGFNEVVAVPHQFRESIFPLYPGGWPSMITALEGEPALEARGEAIYLARRRRDLAARFSHPPLGWSATAALAWKGLDLWLREPSSTPPEIANGLEPVRRSYAARGPRRRFDNQEAAMAAAVGTWSLSSRLMARTCAANGILYLHFLQPNQYDPDSKPMGRAERDLAFFPGSRYRWAVSHGYGLLSRAGEELRREGIHFTDLRALFSNTPEPRYVDICCHLNTEGNNEMAARVVAEIIRTWTGR